MRTISVTFLCRNFAKAYAMLLEDGVLLIAKRRKVIAQMTLVVGPDGLGKPLDDAPP